MNFNNYFMDSKRVLNEYNFFLQFVRGLSKTTALTYTYYVRSFLGYIEYSGISLFDVTLCVVRDYSVFVMTDKQSATKHVIRSALCNFGLWLADQNIWNENYFSIIDIPVGCVRLPKVYPHDEVVYFLDRIKDFGNIFAFRDYCMFLVMYTCGLRISEVADLQLSNIHLNDYWGTVIGKGNKERIFVFGDKTNNALNEYIMYYRQLHAKSSAYPYLFLGRNGKKLSRSEIWRRLQIYKEKNRDKFENLHPHTFRHCFATVMYEGGADLNSIRELLGHTNIETTTIYTHVSDRLLMEAHKKYFRR